MWKGGSNISDDGDIDRSAPLTPTLDADVDAVDSDDDIADAEC